MMCNDPSAHAPRSILRMRSRPHMHPARGGEVIVEVVREGEVVATIFGSREGVHIVAGCFGKDAARPSRPLRTETPGGAPGLLVPLLREGEACPWCEGARRIAAG